MKSLMCRVIRRPWLAMAFFAQGLMGNSCDSNLLDNPSFESWCGQSLCSWEVDEGEIARVPTWRRGDDGVALEGPTAAISQLSTEVVDCIQADLLTDIDPDTTVVLQLDFGDDGEVEVEHPIDGRDWKHLTFRITPPTWYDQVRVRIAKLSPGRAVLGRIALVSDADCAGQPVEYLERPKDAPCERNAQCSSGICSLRHQGLCADTDALILCEIDGPDTCSGEVGPGSECVPIDATTTRCR